MNRWRKHHWLVPFVVFYGGLVTQVSAQTFSVLHQFTNSEGGFPAARLSLSANTLYGTTEGTVFKVNTDGTSFTTLQFLEGYSPRTALVLSGSNLFGTTYYGGAVQWGTVFAVKTDGTGYTNLHSFTSDAIGWSFYPAGGLVLSGNTLYGTTDYGGPWTNGTLYTINTDGTGFTNLHFFQSPVITTDGSWPHGGVILSSNILYGTAEAGGEWGGGVVYAFNTNGTSYTNIHSFKWYTPPSNEISEDGVSPECDLILSGNTLYGTTYFGGTFGGGSVFKVNTDGTGFTNLHFFQWAGFYNYPPSYSATNADGGHPSSGLVLVGDTLFGATDNGGLYGNGTVFALKTDGRGFTVLHSFTGGSDGAHPVAGLVASGHALYGVANAGGSFGNGTLFTISFAPQLTIDTREPNVVVSWPRNYLGFDYSGFVLQSTTNLASGIWATTLPAPSLVDGQNVVTNHIAGTHQFFRLSH